MQPAAVLAMVADMGGHLDRVLVVGCEPAELGEGIGLSEQVTAAIPAAVDAVRELIDSLVERPHTEEAMP
jgi:hydrogenase maturation protease